MKNNEYLLVTSFDYRIYLPDTIPNCVVINSKGGNVYNMTPLYDWIRLHKINTIAEGTCQSSGFVAFTAGEKRISYPSTLFMQHGNSIDGSSKENKKQCKEKYEKAFEQNWIKRMVDISNKPYEFWKKIISDNNTYTFFTAYELKEMGVVTHIIGEDI